MTGTAPRRGDRLDVGGGGLLVARDRRRLGDVEDVELVVRDAATLGDRQLRGADVHAAVELHRVGVHDLAAARRFGDGERQRGLAGAGRADDRDAAGVMGARRRRSSRRRRARRGTAPWPTAVPVRSARPAPDRRPGRRSSSGSRVSAAASPRGQRVVERGLHGDRVGVVAAGRRRGQGVRAVGDDEHADGVGRRVDLGAQPPTAAPARRRRRGRRRSTRTSALRLRVDLPANPAGDQRAQRQLAYGAPAAPGDSATRTSTP